MGEVKVPLLDRLLQTTSRTFALTIPLLREPTRSEVTVAYLLFRVADTLEDATRWPRSRKLAELERYARFLDAGEDREAPRLAAEWHADPPISHEGYKDLLKELPEVILAARGLSGDARRLIAVHTARTARAMARFVEREERGTLRLSDVADLRAYCYAVAGIVGEMLTELFLLGCGEIRSIAPQLREDAPVFGEALQLVNILKDSESDAAEGRHYIPEHSDRAEIFALARRDLRIAARYSARLEGAGADGGLVAFTALPVLLAAATLDRVEGQGPGAKLTRDEVSALAERLQSSLVDRSVAELLAAAGPGRC